MNKELIYDYVATLELEPSILSEAQNINSKSQSWKFKTKLQEADRNNGNGRVYPKTILEREAARYIDEKIKNKCSYCELDHPDSHVISFKNACATVESLEWNGPELWGSVEILNTPAGNIIKEILKAGKRVGISSRGLGTVKQLSEGVSEVLPDYEIVTWDIVTIPSTNKADFTNEAITEGKGTSKYKWEKTNQLLNNLLKNE